MEKVTMNIEMTGKRVELYTPKFPHGCHRLITCLHAVSLNRVVNTILIGME